MYSGKKQKIYFDRDSIGVDVGQGEPTEWRTNPPWLDVGGNGENQNPSSTELLRCKTHPAHTGVSRPTFAPPLPLSRP